MHPSKALPFLLGFLLFFTGIVPGWGFELEGFTWSPGAKVVMHLGLGSPSTPLQDGFSSWNASAADAVNIWNGYLDFITFSSVSAPSVPEASGDGFNSVFFSSTVYGDSFGEDTLAVTLIVDHPRMEADVIVNTAIHYDSYAGPLQLYSGDLHRVFLHEFGHVLGLDHVTHHPTGQAIMEPIISDLDHLGADDIAGVRSLYGAEITDLPAPVAAVEMSSYTFDPEANNSPTSYSASGLPPGLTINTRTGHISGVVTKPGVYDPVITAYGPHANAYGSFQLTVLGFSEIPGLLAIAPVSSVDMIADPIRPRIYITSYGVSMIDVDTLEVTTLLKDFLPGGLAISADGSRLLLTKVGSNPEELIQIDLDTLHELARVPLASTTSVGQIVEGLDGRVYGAGIGKVDQLDESSGVVEATFAPGPYVPELAISADRKTLFVSHEDSLASYDISTPTPTLLEQVDGYSSRPTLNLANTYLYSLTLSGQIASLRRTQLPDLASSRSFGSGAATADHLALAPNGEIYQAHGVTPDRLSGQIYRYDPLTLAKTWTFDLDALNATTDINDPSYLHYYPFNVAVDSSGEYLFGAIESSDHGILNEIWKFSTDPESFPPPPPDPTKNLLNISTRVRVDSGENAMIGGFIVQGPVPKKILIRGLGPSLPLTGALSNPVLDLYDSSNDLIATNNDWKSNLIKILGTQLPPTSEREAAILMTLAPGAYTAVVRDAADRPGLSLVEIYDLDAADSLLANISTRGKVGTGDDVMIGGFIIGGNDPTRILVRAIGPSLAAKGIAVPLSDPVLEIHGSKGTLIAMNDNWRSDAPGDIIATGIPPTNDKESAVVLTLQPGSYTAIVRGNYNTSGVALVEVYNLDANAN